MSLIRGILLTGQFRSQHDLDKMSHDDQRNTLIVEMAGRSKQTNLQSFDDDTLAGMGAVLVFLRTARIRDDAALKGMTADDLRNTLIAELAAQTQMSGPALQGMSNIELVLLGLGKPPPGGLAMGSFIRGVLVAGQFRTQHELDKMSPDDQRNTLIVEMAGHSNQTNFQAFNDFELGGAGALMVFLRGAGIRTDAELKTMNCDDQRNVAIVEIGSQTNLGSKLQGLSNMDLVLAALGVDPVFKTPLPPINQPVPTLSVKSNNFEIRPELEMTGINFTPNGGFHLTISNMPGKTGDILRAHSFDGTGGFHIIESFEIAQVSADVRLPDIVVSIRDDVSGGFLTQQISPNPFVVRF